MVMTDLERVLQGLDCVSGFGHCLQSEAFAGGICAYCMKEIAKKAKELLKEQEAAYQGAEELLRQQTILFDDAIERLKEQEITMVIESENMYTGLPITHCPKCGKSLDRYLYGRMHEGEINFCPYCGQAVKWK